MRIFQALLPREDRFFAQFNDHARTQVDAAIALRDLLEGGPGMAEACARLVAHEDKADAISRAVLVGVRRSFITPFDRGDIKELIGLMDSAIGQMKKTGKAILLFEVTDFELQMRQMADITLRCSELSVEMVAMLPAMRENVVRISAIAEEIMRLEEQSDELNAQGIKALYQKHRSGNAMDFIVGNEIYDHLEKVVDAFEDVANRISGIVIEQV